MTATSKKTGREAVRRLSHHIRHSILREQENTMGLIRTGEKRILKEMACGQMFCWQEEGTEDVKIYLLSGELFSYDGESCIPCYPISFTGYRFELCDGELFNEATTVETCYIEMPDWAFQG